MPGSEAAEAFKESLRRLILSSAAISGRDTSATSVLQDALSMYEAREQDFFRTFPDSPNWALGKQ